MPHLHLNGLFLYLIIFHFFVLLIFLSLSFLFCHLEGHDLSKRLSKQISQATKSLRTALDKFNNLECSLGWAFPRSLEFEQVKNPEAEVWLRSEFVGSTSPVPITVRRRAIDLYHLVDRAKEEATLIQEEMGNVIEHFNGHHAAFSASLADATASPLSMEERGKHVFIRMKLLSIEGQLLELKQLFQGHIGEIPLPNFVFDQGSIPSNNDEEEAEEVSDSLLSLPETMDDTPDSDSECESDFDDAGSAFFSFSGILS